MLRPQEKQKAKHKYLRRQMTKELKLEDVAVAIDLRIANLIRLRKEDHAVGFGTKLAR